MYQWIAKRFGTLFPRPAAPAAPASNRSGPASIENLEERRVLSGSLSHGIVVNSLSGGTYNTVVNMLHDTNTHSVRLWVSVNNYNDRYEDGTFKYIRQLHNSGIDVTLSVVPGYGVRGSYGQVESYFDWLAGKLGGAADRWEIGNEPDMSGWGGHMGDYVNQLLKPAADALHAHGEKVVSGSVSWNPKDIKTMVDAGMLNYVDFVGYHPYRSTVEDLKKCIAEVKSYVGGKPLLASEWSPRGQSNSASWNEMIKEFWPIIRDNFYGAYYYAAFTSGSMAGGAGIMTGAWGGHNGAFYDTYKNLGSGGDGSVSSAPAPVAPAATAPKPADPVFSETSVKHAAATTPVKATAVAKPVAAAPAITAFRLLDARTGKVIKGYESFTASMTIKLKSLPTRYLQIEAITQGTSSVRFAFTGRATRTENYASFTAFANDTGTATGWTAQVGTFTLRATAFSARYGTGTAGKSLAVTLSFR